MSKNIPVIVFNAGLEYAEQLGLTRVLMKNRETGSYVGNELLRRGFKYPLIIQTSHFKDTSFNNRYQGITDALGYRPSLFNIEDYNNTARSIAQVRDLYLNSTQYDSIVSLGGVVGILLLFFIFIFEVVSLTTHRLLFLLSLLVWNRYCDRCCSWCIKEKRI
jgi:DNA-binding LacI/PurR family transcriptional regulator